MTGGRVLVLTKQGVMLKVPTAPVLKSLFEGAGFVVPNAASSTVPSLSNARNVLRCIVDGIRYCDPAVNDTSQVQSRVEDP